MSLALLNKRHMPRIHREVTATLNTDDLVRVAVLPQELLYVVKYGPCAGPLDERIARLRQSFSLWRQGDTPEIRKTVRIQHSGLSKTVSSNAWAEFEARRN